jgi:hypothetical protein
VRPTRSETTSGLATIDGTLANGRTATDRDRLTFVVG